MEHAVFGNLIEEAKWLSSQFGDVSFSHVRRQGNCAAHISARHVSKYTVWMEDVPPHLFAVIQADLASFEYSYNVLSQKKKLPNQSTLLWLFSQKVSGHFKTFK